MNDFLINYIEISARRACNKKKKNNRRWNSGGYCIKLRIKQLFLLILPCVLIFKHFLKCLNINAFCNDLFATVEQVD